ncbi:MAG: DnaJ domain-containing protein [Candidatus Mariimomonas ferrooxydans]
MNFVDRRKFKRYKKETAFKLKLSTGVYDCKTIDYSAEGISLHIFGDILSLLPGDTVEFTIQDPELEFLGEVVWVKETDRGHIAGFKRIGNFKGTCNDFLLADIMIGLQRTLKTGVLEVIQGIKIIKIYIRNGDFIFANSNQEDDRFGEFLIKKGSITLKQRFEASEQMKKTGERMGKILVELGYLKATELFVAIRQQVEQIIISIVTAECGNFEFKECPLPTEETITLNLSAGNLISQGIKRINNLQYILDDLQSLDTVLCLSQNPADLFQDIALDDYDKEILSQVRSQVTLEELLSKSPVSDFETVKTIYAFLCARIIVIKEDGMPQEVSPDEIIREPKAEIDTNFLKKVNELFDSYKTLGFYDIFGIHTKATDEEIKKAYWEKAREFHPDRHFACQSEELKGKLNKIFSHINLAYTTLSNPEKRKLYDRPGSKQSVKSSSNTEIALELFHKGKSKMMAGDLPEAIKLFNEVIYFDNSKAEYHFYHGVALSKLKMFKESVKAFNKAIGIDPFNSSYFAELGHVLLNLGFKLRAKSSFDKALKISPSDERALDGKRITEES